MPLLIENEKLLDIIRKFYITTGINVTLFDNEFRGIITFPESKNNFCDYMNNHKTFHQKCIICTSKGVQKCAQSKQLEIYKCHAGLTDAVAPIIKNGIVLGYLMFGQIITSEEKDSFKENILELMKQYNIKNADISCVPTPQNKTYEQIAAAATILESLAEFITLKEMMDLKTTPLFENIKKYIADNLEKDISTYELCKQFNISRRSLYDLMNKHAGVGIASYIRLHRLEKAKYLLKTCDLSIAEIAEKSGFSDYNYFLRIFKNKYGISPKKFKMSSFNS